MSQKLSITREEWFKGIHNKSNSWNSVNSATSAINRWDEFLESIGETDYTILVQLKKWKNSTDLYIFLNKFVLYLSDKISPQANKLFFGYTKSWIRANGIRIYNDDIVQFVSFPKPIKEIREPLTNQIIKNLIFHSPKMVKVILYIALSSGMRISEILNLKVMDVNGTVNPIQIRIRAENTKTRQERISYISSEAWEFLKPLLDGKNPTDSIFFRNQPKFMLQNFECRFHRVRVECDYLEKYSNDINYKVNVHAFRANYMTLATQILGGDIAHALLGHGAYLDQYFRLTQEKQAELYHKLEPYLTVSDEARQRVIIEEKDQQITELKLMKEELDKQKAKIKRLENSH